MPSPKKSEKKKQEELAMSSSSLLAPASTEWLESLTSKDKAQMIVDAAKDVEAYVVANELNEAEAAQLVYAIAMDAHDSQACSTPRKKTKQTGTFGFSSPNSRVTEDASTTAISTVVKIHGLGKRSIKPYDSDKIVHSTTILASSNMQGGSIVLLGIGPLTTARLFVGRHYQLTGEIHIRPHTYIYTYTSHHHHHHHHHHHYHHYHH
jgi:hypothetical protein